MKLYTETKLPTAATLRPLRLPYGGGLPKNNTLVDSSPRNRHHALERDAVTQSEARPAILSDEPLSKQLNPRQHVNAFHRGI